MSKPQDMNFGKLGAAIFGITNVETLAITSNPVIMPNVTAHILIHGTVEAGNGAGAAILTLKLYRGASITGTLVFTSQGYPIAANAAQPFSFDFEEDLANAAGAQYTLSVTNNVNQANNNINSALIVVTVL